MESDYQHVRNILEEQFQAAVKRCKLASARFHEVNHLILSGLRHPDGTQQMIYASAEYTVALQEESRAVERIADFQMNRIIPEDLRQEGESQLLLLGRGA